ncbi:type IV pilin protein [Colwelliaceae bacterium BS250]
MKNNKGFTLIELMIVVAIVGIIAGIAYPSFSESMKKARRSDGKSALLGLVLQQSKLRSNCTTYAGTIGNSNSCGATKTVKGITTSNEGYYTMAITSGSNSGNAYTLTATAIGVQATDTACPVLTVTVSASYPKGNKTPATCW